MYKVTWHLSWKFCKGTSLCNVHMWWEDNVLSQRDYGCARHLLVCRVSCLTDSSRNRTRQPVWSSVPVDMSTSHRSSMVCAGFRLEVLAYRWLHGTAPAYLSADLLCISNVGSRQRLHSALTLALVGHHTQPNAPTVSDRAFAAAAVWNSLSEEVWSSSS